MTAIADLRSEDVTVREACEALGIPRANYYRWHQPKAASEPSIRIAANTKRPKSSRLRALDFVVAGGRYVRVCTLLVPLILGGAFAAFLHRATNMPMMVGTLVFWVVLGVVAFFLREHWWPQAQWFVNVMARGFIIALQRA